MILGATLYNVGLPMLLSKPLLVPAQLLQRERAALL